MPRRFPLRASRSAVADQLVYLTIWAISNERSRAARGPRALVWYLRLPAPGLSLGGTLARNLSSD